MTTIVFRDGVLCADTAVFDRDCYCGETEKIWRVAIHLGAGRLAGLAGSFRDMQMFRQWCEDGCPDGAAPTLRYEPSEGLVINADGSHVWLGNKGEVVPWRAPYVAIGSGVHLAIGALAMGATAEQALAVACDHDAYTRRPITVLRLERAAKSVGVIVLAEAAE